MRNKKEDKDPLERYYTMEPEARLMASILERLNPFCAPTIVDPSVGWGVLLLAVREAIPVSILVGIDLDPGAAAEGADSVIRGQSYLDTSFPQGHEPFGIIANPPFSLAKEFVEKSLSDLRTGGVAVYLLPVGFAFSAKRKSFFERYPASEVHFLMDRPAFVNAGGASWKAGKKAKKDMKEYAVFVWKKDEDLPASRCFWRRLDPTKRFWI